MLDVLHAQTDFFILWSWSKSYSYCRQKYFHIQTTSPCWWFKHIHNQIGIIVKLRSIGEWLNGYPVSIGIHHKYELKCVLYCKWWNYYLQLTMNKLSIENKLVFILFKLAQLVKVNFDLRKSAIYIAPLIYKYSPKIGTYDSCWTLIILFYTFQSLFQV